MASSSKQILPASSLHRGSQTPCGGCFSRGLPRARKPETSRTTGSLGCPLCPLPFFLPGCCLVASLFQRLAVLQKSSLPLAVCLGFLEICKKLSVRSVGRCSRGCDPELSPKHPGGFLRLIQGVSPELDHLLQRKAGEHLFLSCFFILANLPELRTCLPGGSREKLKDRLLGREESSFITESQAVGLSVFDIAHAYWQGSVKLQAEAG